MTHDDRGEARADSDIEMLADISERWSLLVLRAVVEGARSWQEISRRVGLERKALEQRIRLLADWGLVAAYPRPGAEPDYFLPTGKGIDLYPVIQRLGTWAELHCPRCAPRRPDPDAEH